MRGMNNQVVSFNRRDFLRGASLSALGVAALPLAAREHINLKIWKKKLKKYYNNFGVII